MTPKFAYVLNYFRQIYNVPQAVEIGYGTTDRKVNIYDCQTRYFESLNPFPGNNITIKNWRNREIPFLFAKQDQGDVVGFSDNRAFIRYDILAASFFFLSGWQEFEFMSRHNILRYPYNASLQKKLNITQIPVVNYYFDILKTAIERVYNLSLSISAWGENSSAICLTHDIDKCYTGWRQDVFSQVKKKRLATAAKIVRRRATHSDYWFNFTDILDIEEQYSAQSSFYFIGSKNKLYTKPQYAIPEQQKISPQREKITDRDYFFQASPLSRFNGYTTFLQNADYDIRTREIQSVFEEIRQHGSEVGIHGGFGSHLDASLLKTEAGRFPFPITGGRFHYLNFDMTCTFDILESLGLSYDSTLGFAEKSGFRNGIAFPFLPYNIREDRPYPLLEIPLIAMDTTFRRYQYSAMAEILPEVLTIFNEVEKFNGCLTILWHNAYFSPYKFAGWKDIYENILQEGKRRNAALFSGEQVYERWEKYIELMRCNVES